MPISQYSGNYEIKSENRDLMLMNVANYKAYIFKMYNIVDVNQQDKGK